MAMSKEVSDATPENDLMDDGSHLYSQAWASSLTSLTEVLRHNAADIVKRFYDGLIRLPKSEHTLAALSERELQHLKTQQIQNLYALASPELTAIDHRAMALRVGRIHAIVGLEWEDLIRSRGILSAAIHDTLDTTLHGRALAVLGRRLTQDLAWQTEAYQRLQTSRQDVLLRVTRLAWEVESYTDLIGRVVQILGEHDEVAGCSVGRPDSQGIFRFESVSGKTMERYLADMENSTQRPISNGDLPQGQGPVGRAWRSGNVERSINFATDPLMAPWKTLAMQENFRSSVAIPLRQPGHAPKAILLLYSAFPGGYSAADQMAFITPLQTLLGLAIARIENQEGRTQAVPYATRQHWAALLRSDALEMYYQPLLDLKTGQVTKVEALARLRDGDKVLTPGEFFPALSSDDFLDLYVRGLAQVLSQRNRWLQAGFELKVSVNLPSSALGDNRYFEATRQALTEYVCCPDMLTLEILETDALPSGMDVCGELAKFKLLGINLAEDDLGSGHSSLNRLRELPFDWIKIDRSIVSVAGQDASNVLRFVYQLTRLGRSLGKSVVVEGIEDAGMLEAIVILGADVAQGYAIARPMPPQQLTAWMHNRPQLPRSLSAKSALGKLATLLIWEERLHLICEDPRAFGRLFDIVTTPPAIGVVAAAAPAPLDSACQVCPFSRFFSETESILPRELSDPTAQRALIAAAVSHGPDSVAYRSARQRLVTAIMSEAVEY
ncbi:EAL domain-containing protein [Paraburkholderia sp. RL17-381-BIF-C]|jgi:EAL domain-containing protein (putative c-di-GMP-specific phosphodiesterase class I)|uniref:EAL domain-containing protein n=1 Tax=Paraburkholderia sp. RL17-381-BIF-C TaxID=3031635 RepID=UPI0038BCEB17